jgi:hypothetical protein
MAEPISKKEIKALPRIPYEKIRDSVQTGDIVFCSGSYVFSGFIQRLTKSVWSVSLIHISEPTRPEE